MKKLYKTCIAASVLMALPAVSSAVTFLNNWYLDLDKDGKKVQVSEYLDFTGNSYIDLTPTGGGNFTFTDNGFFQVTGKDGGAIGSHNNDGDGGTFATEGTAIFKGAAGTGSFGGGITFTPGVGTLEMYSDSPANYGSSTGIYGADGGTKIGDFEVAYGNAVVDPNGVPNGQITLVFKALDLAPGYWFSPNMTDLKTILDAGNDVILGFTTSNASFVANPGATLVSEIEELMGVVPGTLVNSPPDAFIVSNNGQYRMQVPEPGPMALLGLGLLGMGLLRKARKA